MNAYHHGRWTIQDAQRLAIQRLEGTSEARLATEMLLAHVMGCEPSYLVAHPDQALTPSQQATLEQLIERRARHEPVPYLIGRRPFLDFDLYVDHRVLIPRPETELLVEQAIAVAHRMGAAHIVDVGTGSGAIAIALARQLMAPHIWATDQSAAALDVARTNARRAGVANRIRFLCGDLLAPLSQQMDLIVANLPYVSECEYAALPHEIQGYEPRQALLAGAEGLDAIRALLAMAPSYLTSWGAILLEIGSTQADAVTHLAHQAFPTAHTTCTQDYARQDRILLIDQSEHT